jgi:Uma2 family endonuclease
MSLIAEAELVFDPEKEYEIVNGRPEEKEMDGALHSGVGMRLGAELWFHAKTHKLGAVYGPDATFQIGINERLPDVSFISAARLPQDGEPTTKWMIVPDLAVEVISPNDLYGKVKSKIHEYLTAGVREVWIVEPEFKMITIYRSPTDFTVFAEEDELVSEAVLPGFRLKLSELFQLPHLN